jgi:hypothetical protein
MTPGAVWGIDVYAGFLKSAGSCVFLMHLVNEYTKNLMTQFENVGRIKKKQISNFTGSAILIKTKIVGYN